MTRKHIAAFLMLLAVVGSATFTEAAAAERRILLAPPRTAEHLDLVRSLLYSDPDRFEHINEDTYVSIGIPQITINRNIQIGFVDLNDDGVDELVLVISQAPRCGTAGCEGYIFERTDTGWREICEGSLNEIRMIVTDLMSVEGYRVFEGGDARYFWAQGECVAVSPKDQAFPVVSPFYVKPFPKRPRARR